MKNLLKRLLLVVAFAPVFILLGVRWVFTGMELFDTMEKFIAWCCGEEYK